SGNSKTTYITLKSRLSSKSSEYVQQDNKTDYSKNVGAEETELTLEMKLVPGSASPGTFQDPDLEEGSPLNLNADMIRVQEILRDCDILKATIIQNDTIDWSNRLKLQTLLEEAILTDTNYCVNQQIEQLLWNICFKSCIDFLQNKLKFSRMGEENVKLPGDEDESAFLATFLKSSLSYFDCFMRKIELSAKSNNSLSGYLYVTPAIEKFDAKNVDYLLNFCLIHLGDISRYRRRLIEAEYFYLNATRLCPTNGHAFNQLAILETCRNSQLSALYFYYRSLYVENSFLLSASNLDKFFSTVDLDFQSVEGPVVIRFEESFYKFLACIHNNEDRIEQIEAHFRRAIVGFRNDVSTMSKYDFFHMAIILIANIWKISPSKELTSLSRHTIEAEENSSIVDFSKIEKMQLNLLVKFLQFSVRILLRILGEKFDEISSVLIIILEWMREYSNSLLFDEFCGEKSEFLYRFCDLLNCIPEEFLEESEPNQVLPEDKDLISFLPLESQLSKIKTVDETFLRKATSFNNVKPNYNNIRNSRLIKIGLFLVNLLNNEKSIKCSEVDSKFVFETSIKKEDIQEEDLFLGVLESLVSSRLSDNATPRLTPAAETTKSRRQTKVLPLLGLTTKDSAKAEKEALIPKFKIAPAGSKVEMVLKGEVVEEIADHSSNIIKSGAIDGDKKSDNQEAIRNPKENKYELPPRFQVTD
uniref:DNA/RNA-binding domain-containing protein n=1 Tax=Romanomermis culicivorax TaxID=13658 RepID=A0A915K3S6_ROMCU